MEIEGLIEFHLSRGYARDYIIDDNVASRIFKQLRFSSRSIIRKVSGTTTKILTA